MTQLYECISIIKTLNKIIFIHNNTQHRELVYEIIWSAVKDGRLAEDMMIIEKHVERRWRK